MIINYTGSLVENVMYSVACDGRLSLLIVFVMSHYLSSSVHLSMPLFIAVNSKQRLCIVTHVRLLAGPYARGVWGYEAPPIAKNIPKRFILSA